MSHFTSLQVVERPATGTGAARAVRREGFVPGVLYGKTQKPVSMQVEQRFLTKEMQKPGFRTSVYELQLGNKVHRALIRDIQLHPVSDMPLHVDFMAIDKDSRIQLKVPLLLTNEEKCPGIKKGGVVNAIYHSVDVACSPDTIPEFIEIDLGVAEIGLTVHFEDIALPKGVSFVHENLRDTVLTIVPPKVATGDGSSEQGS